MRIPRIRYSLAAILLATLGAFAYCAYSVYLFVEGDSPPPPPQEIPEEAPPDNIVLPDVRFTEVTKEAGIRFRHFNGATGKKLLPEIMGSGVVVLDFDRDGKPDLLFVNSCAWPGCPKPEAGSQLCLYRNKGDGTFEDVTAAAGLALTMYGMGAAVGDIDNDGYPDVFVTAMGGNRLFHNVPGKDGQRVFQEITKEAGVRGPALWPNVSSPEDFFRFKEPIPWPTSATFVDYDGDGKLDLFVCYYIEWSPAIDLSIEKELFPGIGRTYLYPGNFRSSQCILYRNVGGNRFEDVSVQAGIHVFNHKQRSDERPRRPYAKALGVVVFDGDEDGWPDIAVANDTTRNYVYHNVPGPDGGRRFEEIGLTTNVGFNYGGMGIDWGEYVPGKSALVIANYAFMPFNFLSLDDPRHFFFVERYQDVGLVEKTPVKWGTFFFDYDLDGRLDLLTCNGHVDPDVGKAPEPELFAQTALLYWNTGQTPVYKRVTAEHSGEDLFRPMVGRGSAFLDFDGDGDLDVVITENNGPARLLRNDNTLGNRWIRLELVGDGRRSSRDAIGAHVTIEAGGTVQHRFLAGARGYLSQSEHVMTIGLGRSAKVDRITVRWPGKEAANAQEWRDLAANHTYELRQGQSAAVRLRE